MQAPIPADGIKDCWIWGGFGDDIHDQIKRGGKNGVPLPLITVKFTDVLSGKEYVSQKQIANDTTQLMY
jgi:hypothetical protein